MIVFTCHHCKATFQAEESSAGAILHCGRCGHGMTVPKPKQAAPDTAIANFLAAVFGAGMIGAVIACLFVGEFTTERGITAGLGGGVVCGGLGAFVYILLLVVRKLS